MQTVTRDITLVLDAITNQDGELLCTAQLFEGWPEEGQQLVENETLAGWFADVSVKARNKLLDVDCGAALFDWVFPPESQLRKKFVHCCDDVEQHDGVLRIWLSVGPGLYRLWEYQVFELETVVSWEGFWIREWAGQSNPRSRRRNPFLALNSWINVIRRPPGVCTPRHFTVPGGLCIMVVASNPPPDSPETFPHIEQLDEMVNTVCDVFRTHNSVNWVYPVWNPDKHKIATEIRAHKPDIFIYLGHGYADDGGAGVILSVKGEIDGKHYISGFRNDYGEESELEKLLSGKVEGLKNPGLNDSGLPEDERPRLVILLCCDTAPAAPALLESQVAAVVAMRQEISDQTDTVAMVEKLLFPLIQQGEPVDTSIINLRKTLVGTGTHWTVPVLHLGIK